MFEKDLHITYLLDFYGDMLSDRDRRLLDRYYGEDLSLAEIAEEEGISRQGVRHAIKRAEDVLRHLEEKLGLAARYRPGRASAEELRRIAAELEEVEGDAALAARIRECAARIEKS